MRIIERILHMARTRSECWHVCLWCEHFDVCREDVRREGGKEE